MSNPRPTLDEVTAALRESLRTLEAKYPSVTIHLRSVDIEFEDKEDTCCLGHPRPACSTH